MTLMFPNQSRSFDRPRNCIRFVGHDNVFEIVFCLEIDALTKIDRLMDRNEQGYFAAFDAARDIIEDVARKAYNRRKNPLIVLTAADIR
jgi:hypothetical protein